MNAATISASFARQAALTPDAIALVGATQRLSYADLQRRANAAAHRLAATGVRPGDHVMVCLPRSVDAVIAFLAILKAGAAYVPVEPSYSRQLKHDYADTAAARHAIVAADDRVSFADAPSIRVLDASVLFATQALDGADIDLARDANAAAYVMFTSGSMGRPKGVQIAHRGVVRLVCDTNYIHVKATDRLILLSPLAFDASTFELWGALLNGACLVVYQQPLFDPNAVARLIEAERVTILWLTAALFHLIVRTSPGMLAGLRVLLAGGDVLRPDAVNAVLDAWPDLTVINGYGPTENTTFTCCHPMTRANRPAGSVPIGHPVTGSQVYVLDEHLRPVPDGEAGELCTSGLGVALGYLPRAGAAGAAFVPWHDGTLLYRSGDQVRRLADGCFMYLGRRDRWLKIRGFRVSLDEVQAALAALAGIEECRVEVGRDSNNERRLEAFVQVQQPEEDLAPRIKHALRQRVPHFMVPDTITVCAQLPLNANGKVGRMATPTNNLEDA